MNAGADAARLPILLTELRLPTLKRMWETISAQSDREGWSATRLLSTLFDLEMAERAQRRLARHRDESQLPADKRLETFDFAPLPLLSKAHVQALAEGDAWIEKGANLLLFGPPGGGKTHLACALGHALIDRGWRVFFTGTSELVQKLQAASRSSLAGRAWQT
jgi:DNA replication protein DnaC